MFPNLTKAAFVPLHEVELQELKVDGSNKSDFYVADVLGDKKFAQNYGGFPRSDVALINEQNDLRVAKVLLDGLVELPNDNNPNAALSDSEILLSHRSRYQQTPSERISYIERQLVLRDSKRPVVGSKESEGKIEFAPEDTV